jgi:Protein of unknown function (DUF3800)
MYLCYVDESGTADIPGNTSHYVLVGLSIPISYWRACDRQIETIKRKYGLDDAEVHVAWILRKYPEQNQITGFEALDYGQRRSRVANLRNAELLRLQRSHNSKHYQLTKKTFRQTISYIHLSFKERHDFILEIADCISNWGFARLFGECVDKTYFDPQRGKTVNEQSFEQVVSRFEQYLKAIGEADPDCYGLIIHDNNETVALKHTTMMRRFHQIGTMWTGIEKIIETPLFVDSQLTSMVQIADVCAYAVRRYLENGESEIFDKVFTRADRRGATVVGVRHYTRPTCNCKICQQHKLVTTQTRLLP